MWIEHTTKFHLAEEDYNFIKKAMKEKKLKITSFCKKYSISRTHFYDMARGKEDGRRLIIALRYENIYVPYDIARDSRLEW